MPSPIAHIAAGVAVGLIVHKVVSKSITVKPSYDKALGYYPLILLAVIGSVLPDVDGVVGLLAGDFGKYHNNLSHSFVFGLLVSTVLTLVLSAWKQLPKKLIFISLFAAYSLHIIMDAAAVTRGVMLLWPFTEQRFATPIPLFYGVRWSEGLFAWQHLITIVTEIIFGALFILLVKRSKNRQ